MRKNIADYIESIMDEDFKRVEEKHAYDRNLIEKTKDIQNAKKL